MFLATETRHIIGIYGLNKLRSPLQEVQTRGSLSQVHNTDNRLPP
jgi:hypothetical protein